MGQTIVQVLEGSCLHDLMYYVLNDSECHSTCTDNIGCGCETHHMDDNAELSIEVDGVGSIRKGPALHAC